MADFYTARFSATFTPAAGGEAVALARYGHLLPAPPTREWTLQTNSYECIAHTWAHDDPTGNARLNLSWAQLIRAHTTAALEARLRRLEIQLNIHRRGTLLLEEAYADSAPTLRTTWQATLTTATPSLLTLDESPGLPGAWGKLELAFTLTNPE